MTYTTIDPNDIEVGKPTKKKIFQTIKDNLDDHETRIDSLQAGASKIEVFNFEVFGYINDYNINELTSVGIYEAPAAFTLSTITISLQNNPQFLQSSSDGVLEVDLQKSTDNGVTWNTILNTKPSIGVGVSATGSKSTNGSINSGLNSINQGDLLRVSITSLKNNQGSFNITAYGDL